MPETIESLKAKLGLKTEEDISRLIASLVSNHPELSLEHAFRLACEDKEIVLGNLEGIMLFRTLCGYQPPTLCAVGC